MSMIKLQKNQVWPHVRNVRLAETLSSLRKLLKETVEESIFFEKNVPLP